MQTRVFVERIEGVWAILETVNGDSFIFPLELLPQPVQEGTCFVFTIEEDADAQKHAEKRVRSLRKSLRKSSKQR